VLKSLKSLKELVFTKLCISCAAPGYWLCPSCLSAWNTSVKKNSIDGKPIYFKSDYTSKTASVILAAKEGNDLNAIALLASAISQSIAFSIADLRLSEVITLITIPSAPSAIRRRGQDHINTLAKYVQRDLQQKSITAYYAPILFQKKSIRDQSQLSSQQRMENTKGKFAVKSCEIPQGAVYLIDDLITTGASMLEGVRALSEAKITIAVGVTACAVGRISLIP
jgi:predicted amidophosphoribosyltransferase